MSIAPSLALRLATASPVAAAVDREARIERLSDAIADLAARLHAATYELLVLLREFDACAGWNNGFLSCAHWLHWRTGIALGAAREKVRVARALTDLPQISAAMRCGELSYAKVRAITRVATPESELKLLAVARAGTAAQVERIVGAWRRVDRVAAGQLTERRHRERHLTMWTDDDGSVIIRGRLTPEIGAVVQRALEAAADRLSREAAQAEDHGTLADEETPGQRRADALGRLAESALADLDRGTAGDRYQVVLHVEASAPEASAAAVDVSAGQTVIELGHAATCVSAETSARLACDASLVVMRHGEDGSVLDVGRKTRTVPPAIRRALEARDQQCQFPGCTARRCDAHHLRPWALGGHTSLRGLLLLCRRHHRAVHEGGYRIERSDEGIVRVWRPDGRLLPLVPASPPWAAQDPRPLGPTSDRLAAAGVTVGPKTIPLWDGTRLDLGWAIDVLRSDPMALP